MLQWGVKTYFQILQKLFEEIDTGTDFLWVRKLQKDRFYDILDAK